MSTNLFPRHLSNLFPVLTDKEAELLSLSHAMRLTENDLIFFRDKGDLLTADKYRIQLAILQNCIDAIEEDRE